MAASSQPMFAPVSPSRVDPAKGGRGLIVVAATSARLLAEAARAGGYEVVAIDAFGDADTRAAAREWLPIAARGKLVPAEAPLLAALAQCARMPRMLGWIAGSGFEAKPELLASGAKVLPLLGNPAETVLRIRTPEDFFSTLRGLGVPAPQTTLLPPADTEGWLFKDARACGGWHIRPAARAPAERGPGAHFQRREAGVAMSALFVANGTVARIVGIAWQLVSPLGRRPFVYRGCVGPVTLAPAHTNGLAQAATALARHYGLRGLNGIDFLLGDEGIRVLELNPRPTASLALFDGTLPEGLIAAHIEACQTGRLPADTDFIASDRVLGSEVVFAQAGGEIKPIQADWLAAQTDCHDLPSAGTRYARHDPVCSITCEGATPDAVTSALGALQARILARLEGRIFAHAADAFRWACFMDVATLKPGNVSLQAAGHDMQAQQFLDSAHASVAGLFDPVVGVGARIHAAVRATRAVAGCNTNLGILLLCAPLALAVQRATAGTEVALKAALDTVLDGLDREDAREAFAAIAHANPGGLGQSSEQDVHAPPSVGLRAAMQLAAHRDRIAAQYANGFSDVWGALDRFRRDTRGRVLTRRVQALYLALLAEQPDSHIARKFGEQAASDVSASAASLLARFAATEPEALDDILRAWDASLKAAGLNPGTTADLTVCVLFVAALLDPSLIPPALPGGGSATPWTGAC